MVRPIVVIASIVAVANSLFLPSVTYSIGSGNAGVFNGNFAVVPAALTLILCLLTWRWRGVVWGILALIGIWAAFTAPMAMYQIAQKITASFGADSTYGPASYTYGLYINLVAYAAIVGASIWDVILKRRENSSAPAAPTPA
jgi:hypothetical protein